MSCSLRDRRGSMLVVAVVVIAVASALAVAAGFAVRGRAIATGERLRMRDGARHAESAAVQALMARVAADTNGCDSLDEPWAREPWELREDGWILRVSGTGWKRGAGETIGLIDAERSVSINDCGEPLLRELFAREVGMDGAMAAAAASSIVVWREERRASYSNLCAVAGQTDAATNTPPFSCVEELALVPGLPDGIAAALSPLVTAHGSGKLNLNTCPRGALECLLVAESGGDIAAALRLRDRIAGFRDAGGIFDSADALSVARALGGIPPDETAVLARAVESACVASTAFSGIAEAQSADDYHAGRAPFRHVFTWTKTPPAPGPTEE